VNRINNGRRRRSHKSSSSEPPPPFGGADVCLGFEVTMVPELDEVKNEVVKLEAVVKTVVVELTLVLVAESRLLLDV